jgi:hypothetical protein
MGMPEKIASSMAGGTSLVPGILMRRFGRPAFRVQGLGGRECHVFQGQLEEQGLARLAFLDLGPDGRIRGRAVLDGVIEDGRVGGEPGHREPLDVARKGAGVQQVAGDVVEPETLALIVEPLGGVHRVTSDETSSGKSKRHEVDGRRCPDAAARR